MVVHIFKISDELFQDFQVKLNINYFDSLEQICSQVKRTLKTHLETHNFSTLIHRLKYKHFHTHDYTFFDILKEKEPKIYWICSKNIPEGTC